MEIQFLSQEKEGKFEKGINLLKAAEELGVAITSPCGGEGRCGKCKVIVEEGKENLSDLTADEKNFLKKDEIESDYRLACQTEVEEKGVKIEVPEEARKQTQIILTEGKSVEYEKNPVIKEYPLKINKPTLEDVSADFENIANEMERKYNLKINEIDYLTQQNLPGLLREKSNENEKSWNITTIVRNEEEIIDIVPNTDTRTYGLAIDLGTTTIVGFLMDLSSGEVLAINSIENPQVKYGEDLMSRITTILQEEKREEAQKIIVEGINEIIKSVSKEADISKEQIFEIEFVGNTAMHHLFLKIDPKYVGRSPYPPGRQKSIELKAGEIGIEIHPSGYIHWIPINAGWVGADNVSVMLATEIYKKSEIGLVVDIGTNGEIALGNEEKAYVCSTAAGPALEGGEIEYGMRATPGSIENVVINPDNYEVDFETIGDMAPKGICGSGIVDVTAEMLKAEIIDRDGKFSEEVLKNERFRQNDNGVYEYVIAWKGETSLGSDIVISQQDIREVQKAKGAMQAGARTLMDKMSIEEVDKVLLAGAFGNYIDKNSAIEIGLFPYCELEKIENMGNAAGYGAQMAMMSIEKRKEANKIPEIIEYFELASSEKFEKHFMDTMYFPHKDESLYS